MAILELKRWWWRNQEGWHQKGLVRAGLEFANSKDPLRPEDVYRDLRIVRNIEATGWLSEKQFDLVPDFQKIETAKNMEVARYWLRRQLARLANDEQIAEEIEDEVWQILRRRRGEPMRVHPVRRTRLLAWLADVAVVGFAVPGRWYLKRHGPGLIGVPMSVRGFCAWVAFLASRGPYYKSLYRCKYERCNKFFLSPYTGREKKGGRRREFCSDQCRERHQKRPS
jgi:hypothetical protein